MYFLIVGSHYNISRLTENKPEKRNDVFRQQFTNFNYPEQEKTKLTISISTDIQPLTTKKILALKSNENSTEILEEGAAP